MKISHCLSVFMTFPVGNLTHSLTYLFTQNTDIPQNSVYELCYNVYMKHKFHI